MQLHKYDVGAQEIAPLHYKKTQERQGGLFLADN